MENQVADVRKGAWTPEEDTLLQRCVLLYGEGQWHLIPVRAGLRRCRKSCRLRWLNYLKPSIKRGDFQEDEVDLIIRLHKLLGNRGRIPGRTANDIKNYWNSCWSKKVGAQAKVARKINKRNTVGLAVESTSPAYWTS
ncbi:unnamed protein product [Spirodela intermedia]|uniref:Uncharacterized protein n=1 Tax=Spirodela intermedia TaxID=51605 RepID=A0A7I8J4B2_SPIIN|nr:unnamed protein product [Spirodela intermedia]CAA6664884.1 unnamed protein product [Spirodela intermedia]